MNRIKVFPVRHHSPASSLLVHEFIQRAKPRLILVEGPSDANHLINILTDSETEPPVTMLAYYVPQGGSEEPQYIMYPFASYSPEYVALREVKALKIKAEFIDIPSSVAIQFYKRYERMISYEGLFDEMALRFGYRSYEEFWEASFESSGMDLEGFIKSMLEFAGLLRWKNEQNPDKEFQKDQLREQFMLEKINTFISEGLNPEEILVACGAFHAEAFADSVRAHGGAPLPLEVKYDHPGAFLLLMERPSSLCLQTKAP